MLFGHFTDLFVLPGTDEAALIGLLTQRSNEQRQQIRGKFKLMYGKVLQSVGLHVSCPQLCMNVSLMFNGFSLGFDS